MHCDTVRQMRANSEYLVKKIYIYHCWTERSVSLTAECLGAIRIEIKTAIEFQGLFHRNGLSQITSDPQSFQNQLMYCHFLLFTEKAPRSVMNIRVKTATYTQPTGTLNSPSRAGTETTLLFAPTTSSRNYELLHWKRLQILILGRGRRVREGVRAAEISEFLGQLFACINRRVTSHVMQSQIAWLVLRFVTVVYHLACGFRVSA